MKAIPIHEAKANLSKYIQQAKAGKPVYIGARGETEVVLTAVPKKKSGSSLWGSMKGQFNYSDEEWDKATRLVNEDFEKSEIFPDAD
ncbi:MAG TPA: type II toxin-antitoxin system prevent-host-death family antitoxin [Candidatus Saccharimonadales bacterium]|jgi:prevent-host-death family protein|nr:type II toxin-antitoxin system prevent-host-death family antitoxin [Candidatus Saccharimonadales bacterium]